MYIAQRDDFFNQEIPNHVQANTSRPKKKQVKQSITTKVTHVSRQIRSQKMEMEIKIEIEKKKDYNVERKIMKQPAKP